MANSAKILLAISVLLLINISYASTYQAHGPYTTGEATNIPNVTMGDINATVGGSHSSCSVYGLANLTIVNGQIQGVSNLVCVMGKPKASLSNQEVWLNEGENGEYGPYAIGQPTNIPGVIIANVTGTISSSESGCTINGTNNLTIVSGQIYGIPGISCQIAPTTFTISNEEAWLGELGSASTTTSTTISTTNSTGNTTQSTTTTQSTVASTISTTISTTSTASTIATTSITVPTTTVSTTVSSSTIPQKTTNQTSTNPFTNLWNEISSFFSNLFKGL